MREWDASVYHRVSDPQLEWGLRVLDRLPLNGDELVLDIGCGTGRLTGFLLERLPRGRAVAVDLSVNMLQTARDTLAERFGPHIRFLQADASALPFSGAADAIFSTASFHWVLDHARLFRSLFGALAPGGRLVAQCGGKGNIAGVLAHCEGVMQQPSFRSYFSGWRGPWEFADAKTTARRLLDAGFVDVQTSVEPTPALMSDRAAYREFVAAVVCRQHLQRLPSADLRDQFMDMLTEQAATDSPAFELDYWRLNMSAYRPAANP